MKRITGFAICFIVCLMLLGIGGNNSIAAEYDSITPALSEAIQDAMQQANITGLSVALVDDQQIVWAEGFGYADKANDVKATPETLYGLASVSKLFTATAIMQLVDQGKIDLDQPLQTYLPEFSVKSRFPDADPITVRHLLTHHSGLPSDWLNGMQTLGDDQQALITRTFASLLDEISDTYVANPPNTVMSYSNLGYSVLGHVIERVSGQEFSAYVDETLLKPLGMPASSFAFTPAMASTLSKEYLNGEQQEYNWSRDIPAAMLHSTVLDLGQFMTMMFADGKAGSQQILRPQTVTEMWRPQNSDVPLDFDARWGLSWWLLDIGLGYAGKTAWHAGGEGMWNSLLVTLPDHKLGVVVLNNSGGAGAINFQIAPKILEHALEVKTGITRPPVEPLEVVALSPDEVHSYEGLYTTESVGPISIRSEGTDLYAEAMGQPFKLLHHGDGRFSIEGVGDTELCIKTVNNRTALKLQGMAVGGLGFGERIEPGPISEIWQNRLGIYEIINGNPDFETFLTDIHVKYDREVLVFEVVLPLLGMQVGLPMMPISDTEAITLGLGRNCGETISVVEVDGEEHLFYSGYLMKKTGSVEKKPAAGNVYEDPQGRFSMPLIGEWTPVETDGTYARYAYADMDLAMSIVTVETDDLEASVDPALRQVGVDPAALTETKVARWDKWNLFYYSLEEGQGVTVLAQAKEGTSYVIVATGNEDLTANPPEDVLKTIREFSLAGEDVLPATVEAFETYTNSFAGDQPPGLSIAIALGKDILYTKGFGLADGPKELPAAPNTVYHWGSVTKTVTATAIMQLREQGLLDLDAPVSDYLKYFPAQYPITVRRLLTHSSGLPEPINFVWTNLRLHGQPLPDFDLIDRTFYAELSDLMFEPGSQSGYVNPDYLTLGQIVAAVSGQPYVEYVQEHILTPLGMENTDFTYSNNAMIANAAACTVPVADAERYITLMDEIRGLGDGADYFRETDDRYAWMNPYIVGESSGGGLMGPVSDMIRFGQMMLNGGELDGVRILTAESVALFQDVQKSTSGEPLGIGLAWHFGEDTEHPYIEHNGGGAGIQAKLRLYMQDGVAIAVMANGAGFDRNEFADAAANVVFTMMGAGAQQEAPAPANAPPSAQTGNVYEDPQGRFNLPLIGEWTPVETDGTYALFDVVGIDLSLYVVAVESAELEAGIEAALKTVGIDPAALTQTQATALGSWNVYFNSAGEGKGVTVMAQIKDATTYCMLATGEEGLTQNPPDHVMKTLQSFTFAGEEVVLPGTVPEFEIYMSNLVQESPPGLSIVIAMGQDVVYANGFGMADGPQGMAAAPDTVFQWASMTKMVTATAIMQLHDRGLIDLDTVVSEYLDYFPAEYPITVRQLLTHSAGLPEPAEYVMVNLSLDGTPLSDPDQVERDYYAQFSGSTFEPGSASAYSNIHFVTLGQIVAQISGQPYIDYVHEHILKPLGMQNTDFTYSTETMRTKAAAGAFPAVETENLIAVVDQARGKGDGADFFRESDERVAWMNRFSVLAAHGGLIGPATEAIRFVQMHVNGGELDGVRILSPEATGLMREMQLSTSGNPLGYGLGWHVSAEGDHPYIEHDGSGPGSSTKMRLYLKDGFAFVLMSNAMGFDKEYVAAAAANVVFSMLGGQ